MNYKKNHNHSNKPTHHLKAKNRVLDRIPVCILLLLREETCGFCSTMSIECVLLRVRDAQHNGKHPLVGDHEAADCRQRPHHQRCHDVAPHVARVGAGVVDRGTDHGDHSDHQSAPKRPIAEQLCENHWRADHGGG